MIKFFQKLRLKYKLIAAPVVMIFFMIFLAYLAYLGFDRQKSVLDNFYNVRFKKNQDLSRLVENISSIYGNVYKIITQTYANYDSKLISAIEAEQKNKLEIETAFLKSLIEKETNPEEKQTFSEMLKYVLEYKDWMLKALDMKDVDLSISSMYLGTAEDKFKLLTDSINKIKAIENKLNIEDYNKSLDNFRDTVFGYVLIAALAILFSLFIMFYVNRFIKDAMKKAADIAAKIAIGDVEHKIETGIDDEIGELLGAMKTMAETIKSQVVVIERISEGDLNSKVEVKSDKDIQARSLIKMIDTLKSLREEMDGLTSALISGNLDARGNDSIFNGSYRDIVLSLNKILDVVIGPLVKNIERILEVINSYSKGDFEADLEKIPGKLAFANEVMAAVKNNLRSLVAEISVLIKSAVAGDLKARGNEGKFSGGYAEIVSGINSILDTFIEPINEASKCLEQMAAGNLSIEMTGDYRGDFAIIKNSLNATIGSTDQALSIVLDTADQVNVSSEQVSNASQSLSQSATESASSIEEISATMQEINSQTRQNAENAVQANRLSSETRELAEGGNQKMAAMKKSMKEINEASMNVAKIIKAIDEIAFQTNLLALNAAVEAARAGKHGKGFTVVAEEVRNLAQRSAKAAKETAEMIENSVKKVEMGNKIAEDTAKSLEAIVEATTKVTDLIGEISSAASEQEKSVNQVNLGLTQIDQVTQQNTATAEESAAASQELLSQSADLKKMLMKFKLTSSQPAPVNAYIAESAQSGGTLHKKLQAPPQFKKKPRV